MHILLEKAHKYLDSKTTPIPENCTFDRLKGIWIENESGVPMVRNPFTVMPGTKKCDVETGEDQKGE